MWFYLIPLQVPRIKRKNSKPPTFPVIEEQTEREALSSPDGADDSAFSQTSLTRPQTLDLKLKSVELEVSKPVRNTAPLPHRTKPRHSVTFADQATTLPSPAKKALESKRAGTKKGLSPRDGISSQSPFKRKMRKFSRRKQFTENSFDADDEDMEASRSYSTNTWPLKEDVTMPITSHSASFSQTTPTTESVQSKKNEGFTVNAIVEPTSTSSNGGTTQNSKSRRGLLKLSRSIAIEEEDSPPLQENTLADNPLTAECDGGNNDGSSSALFQTSLQQSLPFINPSLPEGTS